MNQKAAMIKSLLKGEVLSVMNCFRWFGVTNCAREIGRSIERPFKITCQRTEINAKTRYGGACNYFEYRLIYSDANAPGIELMKKYVSEIEKQPYSPPIKRGPKTYNPKKIDNQEKLFG